MSLQQLTAAYRKSVTPLVNLCWATALGAAATAAVATLFGTLAPADLAIGMLAISVFYLFLGAGYLVQHRLSTATPLPTNALPASAVPPAPLGLKLTDAAMEKLEVEEIAAPEHEMASV